MGIYVLRHNGIGFQYLSVDISNYHADTIRLNVVRDNSIQGCDVCRGADEDVVSCGLRDEAVVEIDDPSLVAKGDAIVL